MADDAIVTWPASKRRETDDAIRWACAFCVASKSFLRRERIPSLQLAGVLDEAEVAEIERVSTHTHLYCANKMRRAIAGALLERGDERDSASNRRERLHPQHSAAALHSARAHVDELVDQIGALERIKATRLPIAYVAHLRTFLLLFVLGIPFVYAKTWGWGGVPATALVAFALLGIDGAATEKRVEAPHLIRYASTDEARLFVASFEATLACWAIGEFQATENASHRAADRTPLQVSAGAFRSALT